LACWSCVAGSRGRQYPRPGPAYCHARAKGPSRSASSARSARGDAHSAQLLIDRLVDSLRKQARLRWEGLRLQRGVRPWRPSGRTCRASGLKNDAVFQGFSRASFSLLFRRAPSILQLINLSEVTRTPCATSPRTCSQTTYNFSVPAAQVETASIFSALD
jgi:hypothetical protein